MKIRKTVVICSFLAFFLFGASITILADSLYWASSKNNKFSASVVQATTQGILLSDNDEVRKSQIQGTFVVSEITTNYKSAGEMSLYNITDKEQCIIIEYKNPQVVYDPISADFNISVKNLDTAEVLYEGQLGKFGTGDCIMILPSSTEYTLQFMVKTNREFTSSDTKNYIDFNLEVSAN